MTALRSRTTLSARAIEQSLPDRCRIQAPPTVGALNTTTGVLATTAGAVDYTGACHAQAQASSRTESNETEDMQVDGVIVKLPLSAPKIRVGRIVTITETTDPSLKGAELEVIRQQPGSRALARRLICRRRTAYPAP